MNKALHLFVYLFVVLTAAGLWFEFQLNGKRSEMKDRNRMQEDFIMDVARITETGEDDDTESKREAQLDVSPVEAKIVDSPDMEDVLDIKGYSFGLEKPDHKYFQWRDSEREQLRQVYVLDSDGNPVLDGSDKMTRDSAEDKLLKKLKKALESQKDKLAKTREALTVVREQLEKTVGELNSLKPEARKDKVALFEKDESISKLESQKKELENQIVKVKAQIDELNSEITSLKDEVQASKDETEAAREELEKEKRLTAQLKKLVQDLQNSLKIGSASADVKSISSLPVGDKGRVISVDNEHSFAIVELSAESMVQLKGEDGNRPLPSIELSVKRKGFSGPAGEYIGRLSLRQEVAGRNIVVCDILTNWIQAPIAPGDTVYAD